MTTEDGAPRSISSGVDAQAVSIHYTNYRGEQAWRRILPIKIWFGSTEWHPEDQWLLDAVDIEKNVNRSFAMRDIEAWRTGPS